MSRPPAGHELCGYTPFAAGRVHGPCGCRRPAAGDEHVHVHGRACVMGCAALRPACVVTLQARDVAQTKKRAAACLGQAQAPRTARGKRAGFAPAFPARRLTPTCAVAASLAWTLWFPYQNFMLDHMLIS